MVLIFQIKSMFQQNAMNQFLFLHFPELQNLFIYEESKFSCYFLPDMKCFEYYDHLTNSYKLMGN